MTQQQTPARISPRRAATRQRLLAAASTVISQRGVNGASVEAICEEAGFTRGAFYSNFTTKEDLLKALMDAKHQTLLGHIRTILDQTPPTHEDLIDDVVEKVLAAALPLDPESRLVDAEISLFVLRNPDQAPMLAQAVAPFMEGMSRLIEEGLDRAGRRLIVELPEAINAIFAACDFGTFWMSPAHDATDDLASCRRTLTLVIRAISEPVEPDGE